MPLDPYFAGRLALDAWPPPPPVVLPPGVTVDDVTIPGPHGPVPLRTYRPAGEVRAALLWAHGGGFSHGDLEMPEAHQVAAQVAARAGAYVVSVGYRLADGVVRYPVPIDDVAAAWSWLAERPEAAGPAAIGGASAGAALALAAALRARDGSRPPSAVLLAYPFTHFPNPMPDPATAAELAAGLPASARFTPAGVEEMVRNYVGRISDLPADALPGAARLDGLPPVALLLCEYDDLRPSGELLARQLAEAGVAATVHVVRGVSHGHLNHVVDRPFIDESLAFLAKHVG
jgi:acetyl esterase